MSLIILFCFILTFHFLSVLQFGYFLLLALEFINPIFCLSSFLLNLCSEFRFHIFCISELDRWVANTIEQYGIELSQVMVYVSVKVSSLLVCPYSSSRDFPHFSFQSWCVPISSSQNKNEGYSSLSFWSFELCPLAPFFEAPIGQVSDWETSVCLSQVSPSGRALPIEHWKFIRDFLLSFSRFFLFLKHVEHNLEAQTMPQWGKLAAHSRLSKFSTSCPFVCHGLSLFFFLPFY